MIKARSFILVFTIIAVVLIILILNKNHSIVPDSATSTSSPVNLENTADITDSAKSVLKADGIDGLEEKANLLNKESNERDHSGGVITDETKSILEFGRKAKSKRYQQYLNEYLSEGNFESASKLLIQRLIEIASNEAMSEVEAANVLTTITNNKEVLRSYELASLLYSIFPNDSPEKIQAGQLFKRFHGEKFEQQIPCAKYEQAHRNDYLDRLDEVTDLLMSCIDNIEPDDPNATASNWIVYHIAKLNSFLGKEKAKAFYEEMVENYPLGISFEMITTGKSP